MKYNVVKLEDIITVLTDYHSNGSYKSLKANVTLKDKEDYALMIRATNLEHNKYDESLIYVDEHAYNHLEKSKVYPNDLIINKIGNAGAVYLMPDLNRKVSLAMNLFLIRVDPEKANPIYVYIYLKDNEEYVKSFANGSVQKTITKNALKQLEILLPPINIQNEIVEVYETFENKRFNLSNLNKNLESLMQVTFNSWFIDFEPIHAKRYAKLQGLNEDEINLVCMCCLSSHMDYKQFAGNIHSYKEKYIADLGENFQTLYDLAKLFPEDFEQSGNLLTPISWNKANISEVCSLIKGKSYKSSELKKSSTALVTLKSFKRGGGYRRDGLKEYIGAYKEEQVVKNGDLVFAYTDVTQQADLIGRPALVLDDGTYEKLVVSLDVSVARVTKPFIKMFLYCLGMTHRFKEHTRSYSTGTTVLHLAKEAIPSFEFILPPDNLLIHFSTYAEILMEKINLNYKEEVQNELLKTTLVKASLNRGMRFNKNLREQLS